MAAFCIVPIVQRDVDEVVGDAFQKNLRIEDGRSVHAHACIDLELIAGESPGLADERLGCHVGKLRCRERRGTPRQGAGRTDTLADHDVVGFHKTVFGREHGQHVAIELNAQQHDEHTEEIGKEKAHELRYADMLTEKFPNKIHMMFYDRCVM